MNLSQVPPGSIVVGVDGSPEATCALDRAAALAARDARPLVIVNSCDPLGFASPGFWASWGIDWRDLRATVGAPHGPVLTAAEHRARAAHPRLDLHLFGGTTDPRVLLTDLSLLADTVVVGPRGRGPVASWLLGSVTTALSRSTHCPLLVARPGRPDTTDVVVVLTGSADDHEAAVQGFREAAASGHPLVLVTTKDPVHDPADTVTVAALRATHPDVAVTHDAVTGDLREELVARSRSADLLLLGRGLPRGWHPLARDQLTATTLEHAECSVAVVPRRGHRR